MTMRLVKQGFWLAAVVSSVVAAALWLTQPSSPAGIYVASSRKGDIYWEFVDGKIGIVYASHSYGIIHDQSFGTYALTKAGWVETKEVSSGVLGSRRIECSWLGLRYYDETGKQIGFLRRRFVPFLRPNWMPDWMQ